MKLTKLLREEGLSLDHKRVVHILILTPDYPTNARILTEHSLDYTRIIFYSNSTIDYFLQDHTTIPCDPTK